MLSSKPNMIVVKQIRTKLESEGMFNRHYIDGLISNLSKKRESAGWFSFITKRNLDQQINALNYLLKKDPPIK